MSGLSLQANEEQLNSGTGWAHLAVTRHAPAGMRPKPDVKAVSACVSVWDSHMRPGGILPSAVIARIQLETKI